MRLKLFSYFIVFAFLYNFIVFYYDFSLGIKYLIALILMLIPYYLDGGKSKNKSAYIFIFIIIFLTHLIRPLILIPHPELFSYPKVGFINNDLLESSILKIGVYSFFLLSGFCLVSHLFRSKVKFDARKTNKAFEKKSFLLSYKREIRIFTTIAFAFLILLNTIFSIGIKDGRASSDILIFFVPETLLLLICSLNILEYKVYVKYYVTLLVMFILLALLSGSKGSFAEAANAMLIIFILKRGDSSLSILNVISIFIGSILLLFATFSIANQIKYEILYTSQNFDFKVLLRIFSQGILDAFSTSKFLDFADLVTARFNGFDGLMATEMYQTDFLKDIFSISNTAKRIVLKIIPFDGVPMISSGKAVGIDYIGFSKDKVFAGAVGIWGATQLTASAYVHVFSFLLGCVWGYLLDKFQEVEDSDTRILLQGTFLITITQMIMSGNFDNNISLLIIRLAQLYLFMLITKSLSVRGKFS